jgi:hypothetical protein
MEAALGERAGTWLGESRSTSAHAYSQSLSATSGVEPMNLTPTAPSGAAAVPRRVRHQARDAVALMAFSATSSLAVAVGFLLLAHVAHTGR